LTIIDLAGDQWEGLVGQESLNNSEYEHDHSKAMQEMNYTKMSDCCRLEEKIRTLCDVAEKTICTSLKGFKGLILELREYNKNKDISRMPLLDHNRYILQQVILQNLKSDTRIFIIGSISKNIPIDKIILTLSFMREFRKIVNNILNWQEDKRKKLPTNKIQESLLGELKKELQIADDIENKPEIAKEITTRQNIDNINVSNTIQNTNKNGPKNIAKPEHGSFHTQLEHENGQLKSFEDSPKNEQIFSKSTFETPDFFSKKEGSEIEKLESDFGKLLIRNSQITISKCLELCEIRLLMNKEHENESLACCLGCKKLRRSNRIYNFEPEIINSKPDFSELSKKYFKSLIKHRTKSHENIILNPVYLPSPEGSSPNQSPPKSYESPLISPRKSQQNPFAIQVIPKYPLITNPQEIKTISHLKILPEMSKLISLKKSHDFINDISMKNITVLSENKETNILKHRKVISKIPQISTVPLSPRIIVSPIPSVIPNIITPNELKNIKTPVTKSPFILASRESGQLSPVINKSICSNISISNNQI